MKLRNPLVNYYWVSYELEVDGKKQLDITTMIFYPKIGFPTPPEVRERLLKAERINYKEDTELKIRNIQLTKV